MHLERYNAATTKQEKSRIVSDIVDTIRQASPDGGFVKLDPLTGSWREVGDHLAREKVGQTLRDSLHTKYSSSTKAKKERRQAEKARARAFGASPNGSVSHAFYSLRLYGYSRTRSHASTIQLLLLSFQVRPLSHQALALRLLIC